MQILSTEHFAIFPLTATRDLNEIPLNKGDVLISDRVAQAVFAHKIKMEDVVLCVQRNGDPEILLTPPPAPAPAPVEAPAPLEVPETVVVTSDAPPAPAAKKRAKAAKGEAPAGDIFGLGAGQEAK